jgi:glycosyltransferase involved in cell wall biosynthesis
MATEARMHVLVIPSWYSTPEAPLRGAFFREQALALTNAGHTVGVVAPIDVGIGELVHRTLRRKGRLSFEADETVATYRKWLWGGTPQVAAYYRRLWACSVTCAVKQYILRHGKPDLTHAHSTLWAGLAAEQVKRTLGVPYVVTEHSSSFGRGCLAEWQMSMAVKAFRSAGARLVVSPSLGSLLEACFGEAISPWIWTPNMVSSGFRAKPARDGSFRERPFHLLNVGFLNENKRQRDLLDAFSIAFQGDASAQLRIAGDGPLRMQLQAQAARLRIENQTTFLGELARERIVEEMARADVLVLSSRYETFGIALIEALASGTPVIATRCGGPECIVRSDNGLLTPPCDPGALARAMIDMRRRIHEYDSGTIAADCQQRYGEQSFATRLTAIYRDVLATESA